MRVRVNKPVKAAIPQYALYGDATPAHQVELVHVEDISERSARNGWIIKPHRHTHLFQVLLIASGEVDVKIDTEQHHLRGSAVITLPAGVVHGFHFSPDTQGCVISISIAMQGMDAENQIGRLLDGVLSSSQLLKLNTRSPLLRQLQQQVQSLTAELALRQEEQVLALFAHVKLLLITLQRSFGLQQQPEQGAGLAMTNKLRHLVERHYKEHWGIAHYADVLHVSVSTLNRACRDVLGCTAKKLLQDRLHVEAKRRLIYTRETLDQIADSLGYKDTAYFARVFKNLEAASPNEFRRRTQKMA